MGEEKAIICSINTDILDQTENFLILLCGHKLKYTNSYFTHFEGHEHVAT
jgi:hypothetical protein